MRRILIALAALVLAFSLAVEGQAQPSLDQARRDGLVGERIDGYVGIVDAGAGADVRALVDRVNAERRAEYERIARQEGREVQIIAQIAGQRQIERMPPGVYVMGADGSWRRK
jgi:uncharacterized protein